MTDHQTLVERLMLIRFDVLESASSSLATLNFRTVATRLFTAIGQAEDQAHALTAALAENRMLKDDLAALRMRRCAAVADVAGE